MTSSYAWIIDHDQIEEGFSVGTSGPRDAPIDPNFDDIDKDKAALAQHYPCRTQFRMFDDDGELYYTGTLYHDQFPDEQACYGPLGDFGAPMAGCTTIKYTGQPGMDCG